MRRLFGCLIAMVTMLAGPVSAQGFQQDKADKLVLPDGGSSDEIIVQALSLARDELPVNVRWAPVDNTQINVAYERADMFLACAFTKTRRE